MNKVSIEGRSGSGRFLILCDHASAHIPASLEGLGLGSEFLRAHIAYDIGALEVAERLATKLDSPLIHPGVSRLVVDCNRSVDHHELIVASTEFGSVPGNEALANADVKERLSSFHAPYHDAVAAILDERVGKVAGVIAIHSFTPVLAGQERNLQVGLLTKEDDRLAMRMSDALAKVEGLIVGINQPYAPENGVYYTLERHAESTGLPSVMIELRNDLLADEAGQTLWADRLAAILGRVQL